MLRLLTILIAAAALFLVSGCTIQYYEDPDAFQDEYYEDEYYEDDEYGVFDEFEELQFWGQWVDLYPYGEVWRPSVVLGWRPYDHGHWIWCDYGWTWVSYEPFGWITYHYGFWVYDVVWGWVWIPDYEWSPAPVHWVIYDDVIAWAPLPPPGVRIGEPWNVTEVYPWHVVPASDFTRPDIGRYHIGYKDSYRVRGRSAVKYKAPQVDYIEQRTGGVVRPVPIELSERYKRGDRVIKRVDLPPTEVKRVDRYSERIEQKIRDADPPERGTRKPHQDDRIVPTRDDRQREPEKKREPERKREPTKKDKRTDTKPRKQEPDTPKAKQPEKPVKQEPDTPKEKKQPPKKKGERKPKKKRG